MECYCRSKKAYTQCCSPFIETEEQAKTAEQLMRSRYSAYVLGRYDYVLNTYTKAKQSTLSTDMLADGASQTTWLHLDVIRVTYNEVEFKAWYFEQRKVGLLHESSSFILEDNTWRYDTGVLHDDTGFVKIGRNDSCFCRSGKKFKQCCQRKQSRR